MSDKLFVVTNEEDQARVRQDAGVARKADADGLRRLRAVVEAHLAALAEDLKAFEQTTEGRFWPAVTPADVGGVLEALRVAYLSGRANHVRLLSDYVEKFLEDKRKGGGE